jgi:parallel beta-helix repeat protein
VRLVTVVQAIEREKGGDKVKKRLLLTLLMLSLIVTLNMGLFIGAARANPDTLYVDDDYDSSTPGWGVDHFNQIQDAADSTTDGDTIYVYKGIYHESVEVTEKNNLAFIAEKGGKPVKSVVIDADGDDGFEIRESSGLTISGFKITDANVGIDTYLVDHSTFNNNHIEDCWQYGIYIIGNYNSVVHNYIKNTGGIHIAAIGDELIGNLISKNTILHSDVWGIYLHNGANCSITKNFIFNASVGIDLSYYGGNCSRNVIMHNEISNVAGGIKLEPHVYLGLPFQMEDNTIGHNYIHDITPFPGYLGYGIDIQYWGGGVVETTHILHNMVENSDIGIRNHGNYGKVHHNEAINCATDYIDSGTANIDFKNSWNP